MCIHSLLEINGMSLFTVTLIESEVYHLGLLSSALDYMDCH
jgi:hypothetical protein